MTSDAGAPVVVGVDGSPGVMRAVRLGAAEARLRGRSLRLLHAVSWPYPDVAASPETHQSWGQQLQRFGYDVAPDAIDDLSGKANWSRPIGIATKEV